MMVNKYCNFYKPQNTPSRMQNYYVCCMLFPCSSKITYLKEGLTHYSSQEMNSLFNNDILNKVSHSSAIWSKVMTLYCIFKHIIASWIQLFLISNKIIILSQPIRISWPRRGGKKKSEIYCCCLYVKSELQLQQYLTKMFTLFYCF